MQDINDVADQWAVVPLQQARSPHVRVHQAKQDKLTGVQTILARNHATFPIHHPCAN